MLYLNITVNHNILIKLLTKYYKIDIVFKWGRLNREWTKRKNLRGCQKSS